MASNIEMFHVKHFIKKLIESGFYGNNTSILIIEQYRSFMDYFIKLMIQ